ncbi:hypothetical protein O0I10_011454 [Lichtheimia ornata]|uniref:F-box domain-containing protein n=1 Tax=Lichtheimia ornata TaxID=688661 RepID=A0AAD7UUX7_9FUNG|nr:uncharacterized protein O0I10_011454 [Lichtheimia ornata]KAJ8652920.1 hypothetical protein O0I10_011454 [Lichtheimia ornata]
MVNVLSHLPSLVSLDVTPMPDTKLLPVIHQYRPNLKLLAYHSNDPCDLVYDDAQQGLEKFFIGQLSDTYSSDDLIMTLIQHCGSLKELRLIGAITGNTMTLEGSNIEFARLEKLEIEATDESLIPLTTSIIQRAPHLHTVYINPIGREEEDLFNAIINLRHLRRFCAWTTTKHCPSFSKFLRHHIDLGKRSTLEELEIALEMFTTPKYWFSAIARLRYLRTFILWFCHRPTGGAGDYVDYRSIMSTLSEGCPSLENLSLFATYATIPKGSICPLHAHPGLRSLTIESQDEIPPGDITAILAIPNLKHLVLDVPMNDDMLQLLQSSIPRVEYKYTPTPYHRIV